MVARPEYVKVGAKVYRVHWSKKAWKARLLSTAEGTKKNTDDEPIGVTHHPTSQIWIAPSQDHQEARATFIHELLHCCFWDSGRSVNSLYAFDEDADPDTEEQVVSVLEPRLTALLCDNPHVLEWLAKSDDPAQPSQTTADAVSERFARQD